MRQTKNVVALLAVLALTAGACGDDTDDTDDTTTTTAAAGGTSQCGMVGFTPDSEDAASDITATGLSCEDAKEFVNAAGRRTSANGPAQVAVEGFECTRTRTEQDPLPRSFYECTSGDKKVTFVRS